MARTIIGIFQNAKEAETARQALLHAGFADTRIVIADHVDTVEDRLTDGQMTDTTDREDHPSRTGAMITVQATTSDEVALATEIMADFGAIDVNEFVEKR
jgi:hypothetical protein